MSSRFVANICSRGLFSSVFACEQGTFSWCGKDLTSKNTGDIWLLFLRLDTIGLILLHRLFLQPNIARLGFINTNFITHNLDVLQTIWGGRFCDYIGKYFLVVFGKLMNFIFASFVKSDFLKLLIARLRLSRAHSTTCCLEHWRSSWHGLSFPLLRKILTFNSKIKGLLICVVR